ncbi:NERD domain-containing protein [Candidatus Electronema sp. TJ]|uniref:nuclease-related domain-containing protein n=1 Tax=Candidatus Electronema sp. TJ TaxID=3401573 RepID=UPI003AA97AB0
MTAALLQFAVGLIKVFWLLLPAVLLVRLFRSRKFKGWLGERRVHSALQRQFVGPPDCWLFSNLLLPTKDGSTQLDHVLISPQGVFVIETKNMQGMISGSAQDRDWTQEIDGRRRSFQNPLRQNYKHTKTLHELLGIPEQQIFSVAVFVGSCSFRAPMPDNVVDLEGLTAFINTRNKRLFSAAQTEIIAKAVQAVRLKDSFRNRRRHVQHVRAIATARPLSCPLCGGAMVLRKAKKGKTAGLSFWGCAAFPDCAGTRNVD